MESPAIWVRAGRARLGLSTRDLAHLAGVAYPTISRIENGHVQPRWSTLE
jgi:predicted transcriptional regulator